ncbi:uncharacterized protein LOC130665456 isoform X2 [Microplitis mediator]|nr:uncharacterized protein LOC130665456 isoform X2 [Microplitis mediator]
MPTKESDRVQEVVTDDADFLGPRHKDGLCRENEHYNDTRQDFEECCNVDVRSGKQNFCWCNKGYVRDSFHNCIKIEDCPKDEEHRSKISPFIEVNVPSMPPGKSAVATGDANFLDQRHKDGVCRENEHYNDTREDCVEYCQGGPASVCSGEQNFCWCNKGYVRDSFHNCIKIEDCLKDEKQRSMTLSSSDDNDFSKQLEALRKVASDFPVLQNSIDINTRVQQFSRRIVQDVLDFAFGVAENPSDVNKLFKATQVLQEFSGSTRVNKI